MLHPSTFWKALSCAAFAGINGIVRYLSQNHPLGSYEIIFFQHLFGAVFIAPMLFGTVGVFTIREQPTWFGLRILASVGGLGAWYAALMYMPIAQVVALGFLAPVLATLGGFFLLREVFSFSKVTAIAVSTLGGIMIAQPNLTTHLNAIELRWWILLPLLASSLFSGVTLLTRKLGREGASPPILAGQLIVFIIPPALMMALWDWTTPSLTQFAFLVLLGSLTAMAHYSFCKAYSLGEVTRLLPVGTIKFVLSALIGYWFFGEFPHGNSWLGFATVFLGILLLTFSKHQPKSAHRATVLP